MKLEKTTPAIGITLKDALPASVDAGAAFAFAIVATWPKGLSSAGATYALRKDGRSLQSGALPAAVDDGSIGFSLRAPDMVGDHGLTLVISSAKAEAEGALLFALKTVPHATSLAVWDVPSPVVRGTRFEIAAGAKCTSACALAGKIIEIRDEAGVLIGSGELGDTPAPGTTALVFTTIALKAPRKLTQHAWTASFEPSELKLAHGSATARFSFITVAEPEHSVSVKVVNKTTKEPIAGAQVRLGVYRAETDEAGAALVRVPKGKFELAVMRPGYRMPERKIEVDRDLRVRIAAEELPPPDPFALWSG
jgi:hypothetical protein